jgi:hypothetical protein
MASSTHILGDKLSITHAESAMCSYSMLCVRPQQGLPLQYVLPLAALVFGVAVAVLSVYFVQAAAAKTIYTPQAAVLHSLAAIWIIEAEAFHNARSVVPCCYVQQHSMAVLSMCEHC